MQGDKVKNLPDWGGFFTWSYLTRNNGYAIIIELPLNVRGRMSFVWATSSAHRRQSKKTSPIGEVFLLGATDPIRTGDLLITSELLYQLSHSSVFTTDPV